MEDQISLIIPCYNCETVITDCVTAIVRGSTLPQEIILVDDCSLDGTLKQLEELSRAHIGLVRVATTEQNSGPATARNVGVRAAQGTILFFVDSDTQLAPNALELFNQQIKNCDAVVGVYSEMPLNSGYVPLYKAWLYMTILGGKCVSPYDQFSASCAGIRTQVFWDVGGYDEWFKPGMDLENEEFGHRIAASARMVIDPSIRAAHHFPGFLKMMRTFFLRTALWLEMFSVRRQFNNVGGTASQGLSTMAALGAVCTIPIIAIHPAILWIVPTGLLLWHIWGGRGFYIFVCERKVRLLPIMLILNFLGSLAIASGACFGLLRVITGTSKIVNRFSRLLGKS
ncbi:MAG: glycosyltransferase family 2 protein [Pseudomonadota bacterium]|nr:glycosyltransferase family 2 protein [Pseudomonadota bacterium]